MVLEFLIVEQVNLRGLLCIAMNLVAPARQYLTL